MKEGTSQTMKKYQANELKKKNKREISIKNYTQQKQNIKKL